MTSHRIIAEIRARRAVMALTGRRHRRRPVPRQLQPDAIRLSYFRALLQVLAEARALIERATPRLEELVRVAAAARGDARLDMSDDEINNLIDHLAEQFFAEFTNTRLADLSAGFARKTATFQREQMARQFKAALGIDIVRAEPWLEPKIRAFTAENVALIKSIPQKYFTEVEKEIVSDMRTGLRWEGIAKNLDRRFEVAEGHAKLVARDQVGKFMGELNKQRQQDLGVTSFIWRTARDNRVREEHQALEGEEFTWDNPPAEGIPGEPINCRCMAEPVVKPIIDAITEEEKPQAPSYPQYPPEDERIPPEPQPVHYLQEESSVVVPPASYTPLAVNPVTGKPFAGESMYVPPAPKPPPEPEEKPKAPRKRKPKPEPIKYTVEELPADRKEITQVLPFDEAAAWHEKAASEAIAWRQALPESQRHALGNYQGSGYSGINGQLRAGDAMDSKTINDLTKAIKSAPALPRDVWAWRGFRYPDLARDPVTVLERDGGIIHDNGFVSTSVHAGRSSSFAGSSPDSSVLIHLHIPSGTRAPYLTGSSGNAYEYEVLLQRDADFKVTKIHKTKDGFTVLDAEYVGSKPVPLSKRRKADRVDGEPKKPLEPTDRFTWTEEDLESGGLYFHK